MTTPDAGTRALIDTSPFPTARAMTDDDNQHVIRTRPLTAWNAFTVLHADAFHRLGCGYLNLHHFSDVLYVALAVGIVERTGIDTWRVVNVEHWDELLLATDARLRLAGQ